jgi:hypothetical protein
VPFIQRLSLLDAGDIVPSRVHAQELAIDPMSRKTNLTSFREEGKFVSELTFSLLRGGLGGFVLVDVHDHAEETDNFSLNTAGLDGSCFEAESGRATGFSERKAD